MPIGKVLIANRGEIALRFAQLPRTRHCHRGRYSTVDKDALHVQLADEAVCAGDAVSSKSYLNVPNILAAATSRGVDAIHPGYGFLAENDKFAEMCGDHGLTFIGPSPHAIRSMGDKSTAKATMQSVGVPTVPGSEGLLAGPQDAAVLAEQMGYPVMIKATAGGGRGMRLVQSADQLDNLFKAAQGKPRRPLATRASTWRNSSTGHGTWKCRCWPIATATLCIWANGIADSTPPPEVAGGSPQPSPGSRTAQTDGDAAVAAARSINYEGAGTVEFLLDRSGGFYFMEMNTRIQVEHPVTEMVTGIDLIAEQLRIAGGEPISVKQEEIQLPGHAIECRINAEDATHNFRPAPGRITAGRHPVGRACGSTATSTPATTFSLLRLVNWQVDRVGPQP